MSLKWDIGYLQSIPTTKEYKKVWFLFFQVYFKSKGSIWHLDSVCSRRRIGDASMFIEFWKQNSGKLAFEENDHNHVYGIGEIAKHPTSSTKNVHLVNGLK